MKVLQINSSIHGAAGQSSVLAAQLARQFDAEVTVRDFTVEPVPHLDAARFAAFASKPGQRSAAQQAVIDYSDRLIEEVRQADVLVLGVPMYNFSVPSQLKAWFDHLARAGVTFKYSETGPVGLITGKKVYVISTRGGIHAGKPIDTETNYLRDFLAFLGMTDVEFIYAEGLAYGEPVREQALATARASVARIVPALAYAA
ncbi:MAG TPA: NAD(P)H-dependent oxidoreductase [Nevskiaceae bacterium]|nr:NAD(P)H-dependent oxidoreductase [Nevskiaceae bacterium]